MRFTRREGDTAEVQPDVEAARENLARIRRRRPDVEALVEALALEQRLNNFTANVTIVFRGGHS